MSNWRKSLEMASQRSYPERIAILILTTALVAIPLAGAVLLGWWFVVGWIIGRVLFGIGTIVANPSKPRIKL